MTENPVERLRNKLSPYMNLVSLLSLKSVRIETGNPHLDQLILNDLKVCAKNLNEIREHLDHADEDRKKSKLDYNKLSQNLNEFLTTQSKEDVEKWLEFDKKRMENVERDSE